MLAHIAAGTGVAIVAAIIAITRVITNIIRLTACVAPTRLACAACAGQPGALNMAAGATATTPTGRMEGFMHATSSFPG